ncbi:Aminopeptidase YwaD [Phycisphaerales bacterium]|nr:Aminopeptidase YwaD [Phycisphaerales bacterium]
MKTRPLAYALVLVTATLLGAPTVRGQAAPVERHITPSSAEELKRDTEVYRSHLATLANPFFEGRAPGTKGNRLAADYIEFNIRGWDLKPAFPVKVKDSEGQDGAVEFASYRQVFDPDGARPPYGKVTLAEQIATYDVHGAATTLSPDADFKVVGYSGDGEATGPLAFAGYSIEEGEAEYSSYNKKDSLKGKIAVVLRFEPLNDAGHSRWADEGWTVNAALEPKLQAAADAGAAGIIFVNTPGADDERAQSDRLEGIDLAGRRQLGIPVVMMSQKAADALVKAGDEKGRSLMDLRKEADEKGEVIDLMKARVTLKVKIERPSTRTDNVGGVLLGKGELADQWIIIGSHYDHVGYGPVGARGENYGKIHPGADDNGSGTCGNLLVAQRLAETYSGPNAPENSRSVLFLWFSAEESGLEGSRYYVNHPIAPLDRVALMLNMDMIGRLREGKFEVGGIGTGKGLDEWTKPYWDSFGMAVKATRHGAPNSDHFSFQLKQVPNLFMFTGLHREYHTPADVIGTINFEGAAQVADLVYRLALDAAQRPEPFEFSSGSPDDATEADEKPQAQASTVGGLKVRFGIMPGDYSGDDGVLIGDLTGPELPAAKAGLKAGDKMIAWGGEKLTSVEQWMGLMAKNKPGDEVEIRYIREGKEETTKATLIASSGRPRQ